MLNASRSCAAELLDQILLICIGAAHDSGSNSVQHLLRTACGVIGGPWLKSIFLQTLLFPLLLTFESICRRCEYAADYDTATPHVLDFSKMPSRERQVRRITLP